MEIGKLIKLADQKGCYIRDLSLADFEKGNPVTDTIYTRSSAYIEMCSIQKWLRDEHKTHVIVYPTDDEEGEKTVKWYYQYVCRFDNSLHDDAFICICDREFDSYEEALCDALLATIN